jgi:hypothetical protein
MPDRPGHEELPPVDRPHVLLEDPFLPREIPWDKIPMERMWSALRGALLGPPEGGAAPGVQPPPGDAMPVSQPAFGERLGSPGRGGRPGGFLPAGPGGRFRSVPWWRMQGDVAAGTVGTEIKRTDLGALVDSASTGTVNGTLRRLAQDEVLAITTAMHQPGVKTGTALLETYKKRLEIVEQALKDAHSTASTALKVKGNVAAAALVEKDGDDDALLVAQALEDAQALLAEERQEERVAGSAQRRTERQQKLDDQKTALQQGLLMELLPSLFEGQQLRQATELEFQRSEQQRLREETEVTASRRRAADLLPMLFPDLPITEDVRTGGIDPSIIGLLISLAQFRDSQKRTQSSAGLTSVRFR